jgi:putative transposase
MPRTARHCLWTEAACYHLMNRGHNRETVFADAADFRYFLDLLGRYRQRFAVRIYHYCLMSNHFHLLVQLPDPERLSALVAGLLRAYVHYFNRRYAFVGHLWQGRFKSPAIEAEPYLLSCGRYIERNPLEAGLVAAPCDYAWSSCRAYVLGESNELLSANCWYESLGESAALRQRRWLEFLQGDDRAEPAIRGADWVVGEGCFRAESQQVGGRPLPRGRGRPRQAGAQQGPFLSQHTAPKVEP